MNPLATSVYVTVAFVATLGQPAGGHGFDVTACCAYSPMLASDRVLIVERDASISADSTRTPWQRRSIGRTGQPAMEEGFSAPRMAGWNPAGLQRLLGSHG